MDVSGESPSLRGSGDRGRSPLAVELQGGADGADDGIEFIDADLLVPSFNRGFGITHLGIQLTENDISFSLITR